MHSFFLLTSQENKGVFFCQSFKIIYFNLGVIWFSSFTLCIYNICMCRSSKGDVQWEIIFYSSFIGYTFHTGCKVLCNKHVHILVQQIIILNAINMVDWNLFSYVVQYFFMWFLSSFIQFWKHQNYEWISWEFFWKVKQMFWMSFFEGCQKSSHKISRVECQGWDPFFSLVPLKKFQKILSRQERDC